jgi:hypothetical protein
VINLLERVLEKEKERPFVPCCDLPLPEINGAVRSLANERCIPRCGDPIAEVPSVALPNLSALPAPPPVNLDAEDLYA